MAMNEILLQTRRRFLSSVATAGGALILGFDIPFGGEPANAMTVAPEVTCWVVIQPDESVIIRVNRTEMGQGSFTALPMLVAEELECDWNKVRAEYVDPEENLRRNYAWGQGKTTASRSIRTSQEYLRKAGASARMMLLTAASAEWNVPLAQCEALQGVITHTPSGRKLTYGQIAQRASTVMPPSAVKLKDPKDWKLIGTPRRRLEISDKVTGKPIYAIDVQLPGMLYATIAQCPVFKGKLKSVDDAKVMKMKGVRKIVRFPDAVAVVADSWWQAKKALDSLPIRWDEGEHNNVSSASISEFLREGLDATDAGVGRKEGDVVTALGQAARKFEAVYEVPFLDQATMEPQNCTAHVQADKVEIWAPTQSGESALITAAAAAGMPPSKVIVHKMMLGGGFGRRGAVQDYVHQAVVIAKDVGKPVKLIWTREEDMQHGAYRPVAMAKMTAGFDDAGTPTALKTRISGHSIFASVPSVFSEYLYGAPPFLNGIDMFFLEGFTEAMHYDFPNYMVDYAMRNTHVPVGFWRSVCYSQNAFFRESFVDEMAHFVKEDPYQFRRKLFAKKPKALAVLDAAASKAGWATPLPHGVFRGISYEHGYDAYCAQVVEASVNEKGVAKVHRVVTAIDPGYVVNPLTVELQTEGSIVFGLTAAFHGEISINHGRVEQSNFYDYDMLRIADMPVCETVLVPSGGFWGGCAQVPTATVVPALCNAIFAATGKRIRKLPLKDQNLRKV
jgi:isoquinoline 1-oxidoreductase beta subunit